MEHRLESQEHAFHDPRRRGFRARSTVEQVVALIDARIAPLAAECVPLASASRRVLARSLIATTPVPPFDRAAMDGYAVRGEETFGADGYTPALFRVVGRARPGRVATARVGSGEAIEIATGAPLPPGADTVVPVESTRVDGMRLEVVEPFPTGRHVGRRGEDLRPGEDVLPAGRVLRPQDLGVLSSLGRDPIEVLRAPAVTIIVTGDELLPRGTTAEGARIADMNSPMLEALVARDGGVPRVVGPLADDIEVLRSAPREAVATSDFVLISGGSSTGPEDHAPVLVSSLGELSAHGVALRPASPTGLGFIGRVAIVLLPGNPVSCLCAYDLFAGRAIRRLGGRPPDWPYPGAMRTLSGRISSMVGRVDYVRVRVVAGCVEPLAVGGASILSSTTRADGFVLVPADREGYAAGAEVRVWHYDAPREET